MRYTAVCCRLFVHDTGWNRSTQEVCRLGEGFILGRGRFSWKALAALVSGALLITLVVISGMALNGRQANASSVRRVIPGHLIPALTRARAKAHKSASAALNLSISLSLRNPQQFAALLAAQDDKSSALYHQYLTPQQFKQRFSPTQATVDAVVAFLRSQRLTVGSVSPNNTLIHASGSVARVENAFQTQIDDFTLNGRTVFAPTKDPTVPNNLGGLIANVGGLNNVVVSHPLGLHSSATSQTSQTSQRAATGPGGGYTPSELRTAYDMYPLIATANGAGQTVAIFELAGYLPSDVNQYLSF